MNHKLTFIEYLKKDPNCLYIYNWGPYIYGFSKQSDYLIIVSNDGKDKNGYNVPVADVSSFNIDDTHFYLYKIKYGFERVLQGDLVCGECSCLNKKYIIKEYVKLIIQTKPLQLRKQIDESISKSIENCTVGQLGSKIKDCKFANQIIDNHRILNYNEANSEYQILSETPTIEAFDVLFEKPYSLLKDKTDELLHKEKIEKIMQKIKNE